MRIISFSKKYWNENLVKAWKTLAKEKKLWDKVLANKKNLKKHATDFIEL